MRNAAEVLDRVQAEVAGILGTEAPDVDPDRTFLDLGFTSMAAVELASRLEAVTGLTLSVTLGFDHPTCRAAAAYLATCLGIADEEPALAVSAPAPAPAAQDGDPIVVVGMACRYPGARSPEELWNLVAAGIDAVTPFPEDRGWDLGGLYHPDPAHPGTSYARDGGFVDDADRFDPDFFGISPREALAMDPQQRLLLEVAWEVFEDAGLDAAELRGSETGTFVGLATHDYYGAHAARVPPELEGYFGTGNAGSVASGRLAYAFGLCGPAITVDTACSSSLVALHLACQALRRGECALALVGGATIMSSPAMFVEFSRQRVLSLDGRCRSFAADADGAGWAEGVGMLVVERLSDAERRGHRVLAVVRGSAINQDGATNGLTAPSGQAQERVMRAALADARLAPDDVDAVEGHGTGTPLGDPIEARAVIAAYGTGRAVDRPLRLGSLKSNIGHSQAAAGVGGIIKMVKALEHESLPRTLHAAAPTTAVDWAAGAVALLREAVPWTAAGRPRRAGVSAFGVSGTNAHVILEQPPLAAPRADVDEADVSLMVSARDPEALAAQAERLAAHLDRFPTAVLSDVALTLAARTRLAHRAVVVGADAPTLRRELGLLAGGRRGEGAVRGVARHRGRTAFVFPGQGCQWPGMAVDLLVDGSAFAASLRLCDAALSVHVPWSVEDVLGRRSGAPELDRLDVVQPVLFAVMVSLAAEWRAAGVAPDVVVGHSQGEVAAAHVAGALSLEDAVRIVAARGDALAALTGRGAMAAVGLSRTAIVDRLDTSAGRLEIAAVNDPGSVVVTGAPAAVEELVRACKQDGLRATAIAVDFAAHSRQVDEAAELFAGRLDGIAPTATDVGFVSSVTGDELDAGRLDVEYWLRNLRQTVEFEWATRTLSRIGVRTFLEMSPHPALTTAIETTLATAPDADGTIVVGSIRREEAGRRRLLLSQATAWAAGLDVAWPSATGARRVSLPTYAFRRRRFWLEPSAPGSASAALTGAEPQDRPVPAGVLDPGTAVALVRSELAVLLGHPTADDVDPTRTFLELGCDSVRASELRLRLQDATGVDLPPRVLDEHPTPDALAGHIVSGAGTIGGTPSAGETVSGSSFGVLLRDAHRQGAVAEFTRLLGAASGLRPSFTSLDGVGAALAPTPMSAGPELPELICIPSFMPGSGPMQFARFAAGFAQTRRISALRLPGFGPADRLPASWAAATGAMAEAVRRHTAGRPFVLVGYSIGGAIAHAIAEALEQENQMPSGTVLIDTYDPHSAAAADAFGAALGHVLDRAHEAVAIEDAKLLALGSYVDALDGWRPSAVNSPSLAIRAAERLGAAEAWSLASEEREVVGDHFSVIEGDVAAVVEATSEWMRDRLTGARSGAALTERVR